MNHGTLAAYVGPDGCRCDECRRAQNRYTKKYRLDRLNGRVRTVDATGSRRRLQALAALAWGKRQLTAELGVPLKTLEWIRSGVVDRVMFSTAEKIRVGYDRLCMTPDDQPKAATWARKFGWAVPLAWDDDTIDDPAAKPVGMPTSTHKRVDVDDVAWLIRAGGTWDTVPARFGVTREAVERALHRAKRRDLLDGLWRNTHGFEREGAA